MRVWEIRFVAWHATANMADALNDGWEPFAVTETKDGVSIWLRR